MQSTRIWPGRSASRRLLRFSDWARKGTVRKTISARSRRLLVEQALDLGAGDGLADLRRRLLGALGRARADHDRRARLRPAQRQAGAEGAGAADDRDRFGSSHGGASLCSAADEAGGTKGAGHRRRQRDRRRDRGAARRRGRRGLGRRHRRRGRRAGRRRGRRPRAGARRDRPRVGPGRGRGDRHARHPRQQRRHRRVRLLHLHHARAVAAGARRSTSAASSTAPTRRCPAMQQAGYGRIVSISSEAGPGRLEGLRRLLGGQGRHRRLHEGDRPRERPLRDHRQLDRPRPDRDAAADGRQGVRRDRREGDRDDERARPR